MANDVPLWQRRHAIHVVGELPDDPAEALIVLRLATELVEKFLIPAPSLAKAVA
jgi:hypothetical protein